MRGALLPAACAALLASASACAPSRQSVRAPVDDVVSRRLGASLQLASAGRERASTSEPEDELVAHLVDGELTREEAVQVALIASPTLMATYEELGIAEARGLSMSLLANPSVHADVRLHAGAPSAEPDFDVAVEQDIVALLFLPGRLASAGSSVESVRASVAGAVLETAASARVAHTRAVAAASLVALRREAAASTEAAFVLAQRMHDAGNARDLDLLREQARHQEALLALADAERASSTERARLAATLGLFGTQASVRLPTELPPRSHAGAAVARDAHDAHDLDDLDDLEATAVAQSLALVAGHKRLDAIAQRLGYVGVERFLPHLALGAVLERRDGGYEAGPAVSIALPLFDASPGKVLELESELRRAGALWRADAIELRSLARETAANARALDERARYLNDVVLPVQRALVDESVRQYNAMQLDTFALLDAQRRLLAVREQYVTTLRDAWIARSDVDLLRSGGRPHRAAPNDTIMTPTNAAERGDH